MTVERDENDLTDEEVLAMWDEGEPVDLVRPARISASPWVAPDQMTRPLTNVLLSTVELRFYGPRIANRPPRHAESTTESTLTRP